ncbi:DNA polymerase theta [Aphelenchoides bicaudatus]|nr:DNA polymerase theta [Aphelenchoides bicaudatus]
MNEQMNSVINEVLDVYKNLGIQRLAEYQQEILQNENFYPPTSQNLLLSAPTGSGKNLVMEILALVNVRLTGKKCIFICPYVSGCQEIFFNLQQVWREFGLNIKAHFGAVSTSPNDEFDAIVCTIEKSAPFVNRLFREDTLKDYCTVIIDEVHMLIDSDRGGHLEDLIIKLNYCKSIGRFGYDLKGITLLKFREIPQIISMSATLENPQQICNFY